MFRFAAIFLPKSDRGNQRPNQKNWRHGVNPADIRLRKAFGEANGWPAYNDPCV